jgi:hypothetical protein
METITKPTMSPTAANAAEDCAGCVRTVARVETYAAAEVCADCGRAHLPGDDGSAWRPRDPAREIALLVRWMPAMDARSSALARVGWSGHNGASGHANGGRMEAVDARSWAFTEAVCVWKHLRAMVARGEGRAVALLWTAWAAASVTGDPGRDHKARVEAVALGAAPRAMRQDWRTRAAEPARVRVVEAPHTVVTGRDAEGEPVARRVVMRSTAIVSTQGPAVRALAAAWGEERLRMLWAPARVPGELAEGVALGWAEAAQRAAWEATRGSVRDRAVEAGGEGEMRGAGGMYRGTLHERI